MKCKYCGAPLKIEDEVCPYCHRENPEAKEHRKKMGLFTRQYDETRKDVYEKTNLFTGMTVRITVISVLLVLHVILLFLHGMAWDMGQQVRLMKVRMNRQEYTAHLQELESEGRFRELQQIYAADNLWKDEEFRHYSAVQSVATEYEQLYYNIMQLQNLTEDSYYTLEMYAESISQSLNYVYMKVNGKDDWNQDQYTPEHVAAMEAMVEEIHLLLKTYCHVSEEDLARFPELSTARRQIILERGMGLEE